MTSPARRHSLLLRFASLLLLFISLFHAPPASVLPLTVCESKGSHSCLWLEGLLHGPLSLQHSAKFVASGEVDARNRVLVATPSRDWRDCAAYHIHAFRNSLRGLEREKKNFETHRPQTSSASSLTFCQVVIGSTRHPQLKRSAMKGISDLKLNRNPHL